MYSSVNDSWLFLDYERPFWEGSCFFLDYEQLFVGLSMAFFGLFKAFFDY